VWHARTIELTRTGTLVVEDSIRGEGVHHYALRFHLAPNSSAHVQANVVEITYSDDVSLAIELAGGPGRLELEEGWSSPTWYTKLPSPIIKLAWRGSPPYQVRTIIRVNQSSVRARPRPGMEVRLLA
jgi:hypothetical protein